MNNKQKILVTNPHVDDAKVSMGETIKKPTKK